MGVLSRNVTANVFAAAMTLAAGLASVPLIVDNVGLSGYGVWTLAQTVIIYITTTEAGVGPAVQRFTALANGASDMPMAARLLWSTLLLYCLVGLALAASVFALASPLVDAFDVPAAIREDAEEMFRIAGAAALISLVAAGLGNVQQGLERYYAYTASGAVGAVVFLVGVAITVGSDAGLPGLAWAITAQMGAIAIFRATSLRDVMRTSIALISPQEARRVGGFALRVQMTVATMIITLQTDRVVVGVIAPARTLGQLGIGAQIAEAGRLVGSAALAPIVSRLASVQAAAPSELARLFDRLQRLWVLAILGATAIGIASLSPLIEAWLGPGHGKAVLLGSFLVLSQGINLATGTAIAYMRAVGRPGLEARAGGITIAANVFLTVALGFAFGPVGVVAATTAAFAIGTAWLFQRLRSQVPVPLFIPPMRAVLVAVAAGMASLGWGVALTELLGRWLALGPVLIGAGAAFTAYLSVVTGVRPTGANVRALFT